MDLREWLKSLDLEQYYENFADNDITLEDLPELSADELKDDLGISSLGHRKKLLKAIENLSAFSEEDSRIIDNYPYIIAYPYKLLLEEGNWFRKLQFLKDVFLNILKYTGLIILTEYFHSSVKNPEINSLIKEKLYQPHFGHWNHFIRESMAILEKENHSFLIPELPEFYNRVQMSKKSAKFNIETCYTEDSGEIKTVSNKLTAIDGLINFRNRYIGHGVTLSDDDSREVYEIYFPLLKYLLENMEFCCNYPLYKYKDGSINKLMGISIEEKEEAGHTYVENSIWLDISEDKELPMLPFIIPPEQFMADQSGKNRLFVYEQHTSKRIVYFSPEQGSGETSGEPVKMFSNMLEEKCKCSEVNLEELTVDYVSEIFSQNSNSTISELENEKKIIKGIYRNRTEAESDIAAFFASGRDVYFLASEAGSGKTNLLAEIYRQSSTDQIPVFFLRAIRSGASGLEESLTNILNLKSGEDITKAPFFKDTESRILIDGLNEHKNPQKYLDSVFEFVGKLPSESIHIVVSWRVLGPTELPFVSDEAISHIYNAGRTASPIEGIPLSQYAGVLSAMDRTETADLWKSYSSYPSKEYKPMFSLEDVEARDRIFARGFSNPLILRMFMNLYNRKGLPKASVGLSLWPLWYQDLIKRIPGSKEFIFSLTGLMFETKSLTLDFDSLFDNPKTSEVIRQLDINSPYRRLLSEGVLSLFFREGILYLSFTIEAAFHYLLSLYLAEEILKGNDIETILENNTDFSPVSEAVSILLLEDVKNNGGKLLDAYLESKKFIPEVTGGAVARLVESGNIEEIISGLFKINPANCIKAVLEADLRLERNLQTELRNRVFGLIAEKIRNTKIDREVEKNFFYRYSFVIHEAGEYEKSLEIARTYLKLCGTDCSAFELGFAEFRVTTACRKLMRSKPQDEAILLGEEALEHGNKALSVLAEELPMGHPAFAELYDMMLKVYEYRQQWPEAIVFGKKRIEFIESRLGLKSPLLPSAYNNTAIVIRENGDKEESIKFSMKAIELVESILDPNHIEMAYANWTLANTHAKFGDLDSAIACLTKTLNLLKTLLTPDHPNIKLAEKTLAEFKNRID